MEKKIKIIIVDDNPSFLEGLASLLKKDSRFIIQACLNSGQKLLEYPGLPNADLILMDIEMPELNGIETGKRVNAQFHHIPMIALTMHKEKVILEENIGAGYRGFVYKPDISKDLVEAIDQVLQNRFSFPEYLKAK